MFFDAFSVVAFPKFVTHLNGHFRASTVMREANGELLVKVSATSIFWLLMEITAGFPITNFFVSYNHGFWDPDCSLNRKRERFKVFKVEPRSNRGRTVMTS